MKICFPWMMIGRYIDGEEITIGGSDERDCMEKSLDRMHHHGELIWYSGVTDEDYVAGEYLGRENFIYD